MYPHRPAGGSGPLGRYPHCPGALGAALGQIHLVDRCLLVFMAVLLAQSVYSLFVPGTAGQAAGEIDIVVRTSSAAIFGYFLSANFIRHAAGQTPAGEAAHILEAEHTPASGPLDRIGFDAGDGPAQAGDLTAGGAHGVPAPGEVQAAGCLQIRVAAAIGLLCLVALLALRNLSQWGMVSVRWEAVAATVAQLRDFVSGCVGFLIGCPTHPDSNPPSSNP